VVRKVRELFSLINLFCLGTKIDLREDREFCNQLQKQNIQPIKREQGQRLCKKIRAFKYVECSALTQKGLKQVCFKIHQDI
jgi:GTPase SAR1 family protein